MKYLLMLSFLCEVYRKQPRARIFLNDQLLDEHSIDQNTSTWTKEPLNLQKKTFAERCNHRGKYVYDRCKKFELDIPSEVDDVTIKIEIRNDDNNYTNGFMTRCTLVSLYQFYLIPLNKKFTDRTKEIFHKRFIKYYAYWRANKQIISDLSYHTKWIDQASQKELRLDWMHMQGSSGSYVCELKKKYGLLIPRDTSPAYLLNIGDESLCSVVHDKYGQYENSRDSD